ncbi:MAG: DUF2812 domain-containing protein [Oscillospiraceae bacterium]|nr:DUF2812 domain-containing protein [Oscillospiraceae bacterium]
MSDRLTDRAEPRYRYKLPPCPDWDPESAESWLTDQAARGLHLSPQGVFGPWFVFEEGAPALVRYRLEPVGRVKPFSDGGPADEVLELTAAYGWEYVDRWGEFYIFRTAEAAAPELNSDPLVQAIPMRQSRDRVLHDLMWNFVWHGVLHSALFMGVAGFWWRGGVALLAALLGALPTLVLLLAVGWGWAVSLTRAVRLDQLRRRLARGEEPDHRKAWWQGLHRHRVRQTLDLLSTAVLVAVLGFALLWEDAPYRVPLDTCGPLPFASAAELADARRAPADNPFDEEDNTLFVRGDWLMPLVLELNEQSLLTFADGRTLEVSLKATYVECRFEWLARQVYDGFCLQSEQHRWSLLLDPPDPLDLGEAVNTADEMTGWSDFYRVVVIRQGCKVGIFQLYQYGNGQAGLPAEQWAAAMAESMG